MIYLSSMSSLLSIFSGEKLTLNAVERILKYTYYYRGVERQLFHNNQSHRVGIITHSNVRNTNEAVPTHKSGSTHSKLPKSQSNHGNRRGTNQRSWRYIARICPLLSVSQYVYLRCRGYTADWATMDVMGIFGLPRSSWGTASVLVALSFYLTYECEF